MGIRNIKRSYVLSICYCPFGPASIIAAKTFLFVLYLYKINTENERKMPPAELSIGMSLHVIIYDESENISVEAARKESDIPGKTSVFFPSLFLRRRDLRLTVKLLGNVLQTPLGRFFLFNRPSAAALGQ